MKNYSEGEILKVLREKFQPRAGQTQTQTAAKLGFSVQFINSVLGGGKKITPALAQSLGFAKNPDTYTRKGV